VPREAPANDMSTDQPILHESTGGNWSDQVQNVDSTVVPPGHGRVSRSSGSGRDSVNTSNASPHTSDHVVDITFPPGYFEVCVSTGNFAIDHHEIDISRVTSDSELFELVWDKYNLSRGGLRRLFLRPRDINFVMVSDPSKSQFRYNTLRFF
jgi:hypothetical protein